MDHKTIQNVEDDEVTNASGNRPFGEVVKASRRKVLAGGVATAATGFMAPMAMAGAKSQGSGKGPWKPLIGFQPVTLADAEVSDGKTPLISPDYEYDTLIPWGTPLKPGIQEYTGNPSTRPSADDQAHMIGIGHDGMWLFPFAKRGRWANKGGYLCINHEFGRNSHVTGKDAPESLEDVRLSQHAHGVSVACVMEWKGEWQLVNSRRNRRIHVNTPVEVSGPVAGTEYLVNAANNDPAGTVNNCSSGYTPWGTYLTCEENFNGYFGSKAVQEERPRVEAEVQQDIDDGIIDPNDEDFDFDDEVDDRLQALFEETATESEKRYGFAFAGFGYGWERFDDRFDLSNSAYRNEQNRFGWVVEIDPKRPWKKPVKRSALGRFKHEGAEVVVGKGGRVVVYMGDDQRFDYIYKFVSAGNWKSMMAKGKSPLDEGTLYVAKFNDDYSGDWQELSMKNPVLAGMFSSDAEILVKARLAADAVGATPMDRPEWISVAPNQDVYCTLTNNSRREVPNAPNPLAPNADGHIIRWRDSGKHTGTTFNWDIFVFSKDTHGTESSFSDPDGIWCDDYGRLFIETDGGQKDGLQNQLLVVDTKSTAPEAETKRLLTGVNSDEITGLTVTPNQRVLFCNTQHPGNGDPSRTNFPADTDGVTIPRDCTFVVRRKDGGIVGS
jgi:secreted PhoX family phosphatase